MSVVHPQEGCKITWFRVGLCEHYQLSVTLTEFKTCFCGTNSCLPRQKTSSNLTSYEPALDLSARRSAGYSQKRLTENLKVPYYVGEHFSKEFTGVNLKNVERSVEDEHISNLRNNCWKEKQQSMSVLGHFAREFYHHSHTHMTPSCGFLQRKVCCIELAISETLSCTKELRGLELRAAASCPRSWPCYIKSKFSKNNYNDLLIIFIPLQKIFLTLLIFLLLIVFRFPELSQDTTGCKYLKRRECGG